jgi:hypothetical protein
MEIMMEIPKPTVTEDIIEAEVELDLEDTEDLLYDCYDLLQRVLDRKNPQWLQNDGLKLLKKLEEGLSWQRLH